MRNRTRLLMAALTPRAALALAISVMAVGAMAARVVHVSQQNRAFSVPGIEIARGDTIHFTNDDEFTHQIYITAPGMSFDSDEQNPGEAVDIRFTAAGTFPVNCHIHPKMRLMVTVR